MITQTSYTMDCLHNLLPEELVSQIQKYTSHQICDDKYFTYHKMLRLHKEVCIYLNIEEYPEYMFDMMASNFNAEYIMVMRQSPDYNQGSLAKRLDRDTERWTNNPTGNYKVSAYVVKIFPQLQFEKDTFSEKKPVDYDLAFMKVYRWLMLLVELSQTFKDKHFCYGGDKGSMPYLPSLEWSKPQLQKLLTDNGLKWFKSWNRKQLLKKWYSVK